MRKIDNTCLILGQNDHRYPYSYRIYASSAGIPFKSGDYFIVEWHSLDFGKEAMVIIKKLNGPYPGANKVDAKGRLNFTPPSWVFPDEVKPDRPVNYGEYSKNEFSFEE